MSVYHSGNWILGRNGVYSYTIRHKDFEILNSGFGLFFKLKIDKTFMTDVPRSGNFSNDEIDLYTTAKNFSTCDYMQVTITVTNKGKNKHVIDLGHQIDITLSVDTAMCDKCDFQNIDPYVGVNVTYVTRNVAFILRDSVYVTDVDGYSLSSGGGQWLNVKYANGISDYLYFSWQDREIYPCETQMFSYVVGTGQFIDDNITIEPTIKKFYYSNEKINFQASAPSCTNCNALLVNNHKKITNKTGSNSLSFNFAAPEVTQPSQNSLTLTLSNDDSPMMVKNVEYIVVPYNVDQEKSLFCFYCLPKFVILSTFPKSFT